MAGTPKLLMLCSLLRSAEPCVGTSLWGLTVFHSWSVKVAWRRRVNVLESSSQLVRSPTWFSSDLSHLESGMEQNTVERNGTEQDRTGQDSRAEQSRAE